MANELDNVENTVGSDVGKLVGNLGDTHIYENHRDVLAEQLTREPRKLPEVVTENFTSIFDWDYTDTKVVGYKPHPPLKMNVAV